MTLTRKQPKPRKCKVCKELFTPHLPMAKVCSLECALSLAALQRCTAEKIHRELERQAVKAKLEGMRGKGRLHKDYVIKGGYNERETEKIF